MPNAVFGDIPRSPHALELLAEGLVDGGLRVLRGDDVDSLSRRTRSPSARIDPTIAFRAPS